MYPFRLEGVRLPIANLPSLYTSLPGPRGYSTISITRNKETPTMTHSTPVAKAHSKPVPRAVLQPAWHCLPASPP
jgi:hypothetical protein